MVDINIVSQNLYNSKEYFVAVNPNLPYAFAGTYKRSIKLVLFGHKTYVSLRSIRKGVPLATATGDFIGSKIIKKVTRPARNQVAKTHVKMTRLDHDWRRKNGIGGRTWITEPGQYKMVIVFHDANRAGPHIDVHIDRLSMVYKVKPDLYAKLKYNSDGMLTEKSRQAIIDHVRWEVNNGSRVPQNIDHSKTNARYSWVGGDPAEKHYGAAKTRQVVLETDVEIYKAHHNGPIEFYAPAINSHRAMYLYKIYPGTSKRAPILIWGNKSHQPPKLEDRLHLKMMPPEDTDKLAQLADMSTATAKYDGSSCYFVITKHGTTVWSPRQSKITGEQIEYTFKIDGIATTTSEQTIVGMGELLFKEKSWNPFKQHNYLPSATGSGILNSNSVVPKNIQPEIRIYRIDRIGKEYVGNQNFWTNRELQQQVSQLNNNLKVVELMDPDTAHTKGYEGVVVVPKEASVNDGFKLKWWADPSDWRIDKVEFKQGSKGGVAGVAWMTSLESGKKFKLGPSQMGDQTLTRAMMDNPKLYEGSVVKVNSRRGHEGRASKVIGFHDDKGLAPYG
jgi:hypothetical protein